MVFLCESWFWRGTQSAVVHYLGCVPCHQANDLARKRRAAEGAERAAAQRSAAIVTTQPGVIRQPRAFHTNPAWAEEIGAGPGPPQRVKRQREKTKADSKNAATPQKKRIVGDSLPTPAVGVAMSTVDATSSSSSDTPNSQAQQSLRPDINRKTSTMVNLKENIRSTLHPDRWNLKRYQREDEILGTRDENDEIHKRKVSLRTATHVRRTTEIMESDGRYDYLLPRNPAVNDLHPPIVSQLPRRREDVAWMLLPPPSRAVMEGKERPGPDAATRRPLSVIGRTKAEQEEIWRGHSSYEDTELSDTAEEYAEEIINHSRAVSLPDVLTTYSPPPTLNPSTTKPKSVQKRLPTHTSAEWDLFISLKLPEIPQRQGRSDDRFSLPAHLPTQSSG